MKRALFAAAGLLALTQGAFASANLDCTAQDKNVVSLVIEAITSRDGKSLSNLRGELEIEAGNKIALTASDVKSHFAEKNIALTFVKRTPQGLLEVRVYAKPVGDGDLDFEGTYVVQLGKVKKSGKVSCQAG